VDRAFRLLAAGFDEEALSPRSRGAAGRR